MLEIRPIMNTTAEDVLSFKTCCGIRAWDQNLEIQIKNTGAEAVTVPSFFDLEGNSGMKRVETLMPHGEHLIRPGEFLSFYCFMDEEEWKRCHRMIFHDTSGKRYPVPIVSR